MGASVELLVNCFERTYRKVLQRGYLANIEAQNRFTFARRTVLINNVDDPEAAIALGNLLVQHGEVDRYVFVADLISDALAQCGLTLDDLKPIANYSTWAFAALSLSGPDFMLHWDADIQLEEPHNWISPALELMNANQQIAVANPLWIRGKIEAESRGTCGNFTLSYGFSDQVFLIRRSEFFQPIYHKVVPISLRYPLSHIKPYFEELVDSYLRRSGRYRATYMDAKFLHASLEGAHYPKGLASRLRRLRNDAIVQLIRALPGRHRYLSD